MEYEIPSSSSTFQSLTIGLLSDTYLTLLFSWRIIYCRCSVAKSCPSLCDPTHCSPDSLLCPWDLPGKNTGLAYNVAMSFVKCRMSRYRLPLWLKVIDRIMWCESGSLQPYRPESARLLCPWKSPGKNTGMGCHFLLQGISLTQGSNLYLEYLLHCRQILYCLSPRMWKGYQGFQCKGPPCCMRQSLLIRKLDCFQSLM